MNVLQNPCYFFPVFLSLGRNRRHGGPAVSEGGRRRSAGDGGTGPAEGRGTVAEGRGTVARWVDDGGTVVVAGGSGAGRRRMRREHTVARSSGDGSGVDGRRRGVGSERTALEKLGRPDLRTGLGHSGSGHGAQWRRAGARRTVAEGRGTVARRTGDGGAKGGSRKRVAVAELGGGTRRQGRLDERGVSGRLGVGSEADLRRPEQIDGKRARAGRWSSLEGGAERRHGSDDWVARWLGSGDRAVAAWFRDGRRILMRRRSTVVARRRVGAVSGWMGLQGSRELRFETERKRRGERERESLREKILKRERERVVGR